MHNGSNYDYHFIIKEVAEEFKKQFIFLAEKTGKYITFTVLRHDDKNSKYVELDISIQKVFISYQKKIDEKVKERFFNTYKFSNHDNNKFIL